MMKLKIFAGNAGHVLAGEICKCMGRALSQAKVDRFRDDEVEVQIQEDVRGADVFIVNPIPPPAENLIETVWLSRAARGSSANRITLVIPYLGYNRSDRKSKPREPIGARIVADVLSAGYPDRILLFDLHSEATSGFFHPKIVVDHLYASVVAKPFLSGLLPPNTIVASPDTGGSKRARAYAKQLGLFSGVGIVVFDKGERPTPGELGDDEVVISGNVEGKNLLFVDDIIDSAKTIQRNAREAKNRGAERIFCFAPHAVFSTGAIDHLDDSPIEEVVVTDTVHHNPTDLASDRVKITTISVAKLLADAIRLLHEDESLSSLILKSV